MDQGESLRDDARAGRAARSRRRVGVGERALLVAMAALLVPFLARLTGVEAGPLAYAVAFTPWFTLCWLVLVVVAAVVRAPRALVVSGIVAAVSVAWVVPLFTSSPSVDYDALGVAPGDTFKVATINATFGRVDADEVVAMVDDAAVDVLAVEELTPDCLDALVAAGLDGMLPYSRTAAEDGFGGVGLWSRMPLVDDAEIDGFTSRAVLGSVEVGGDAVAVLAAHPAAPGPFSHEAWAADLELLATVTSAVEGPAMIVGDLNSTLDHAGLRTLESDGFVDAADDGGAGLQLTFPEGRLPFPVVAIDHVMTRGLDWDAYAVRTLPLTGADHRALVVTYALD
ncbi:endonuclease/exonuclease/phosphatase family protein [Demequina salsinemoris]|uniref:endonuclease/exonuclease/phosphatase family protein n=1 Tax=Demequina salsinemoris TaxID=577470 RepID=UPI00128BFB11|nr:endonuclease/exonuclease/phosphatase family protein [Demequina salsinemoris]